jgi:hypothetical protein
LDGGQGIKENKSLGNKMAFAGGRFILLKSVLEGQNVYWMTMEAIPRLILNKIRKLMFKFLWTGHLETQKYHLCRWEVLSRPKKFGGWGFHNLPLFNLALNATTLWRVLNQPSIWQKVIKEKYLHNTSFIKWIRHYSHQNPTASKIWTSLRRALPVINNWLSWLPGSGSQVNLGRDKIMDLGDNAILSEGILTTLKERGVTTLAQATTNSNLLTGIEQWKRSDDLGLRGAQAKEWELFTSGLSQAGITIQADVEDSLIWSGGDSSGKFIGKELLSCINFYPVFFGFDRVED